MANCIEEFLEPRGVDVEWLAACDARKLDGAKNVAVIFVVADHATFAYNRTIDGEVGAAFDQADVLFVSRSGAREVAAFLDKYFLGIEHLGKLLTEPFSRINGI